MQLQILLSSGDEEGAANIAIAATQRYSQSVSSWSMALQTLVHLGRDDVGRLFHEALANIHPKVHNHTHTRNHAPKVVSPRSN